MKAILLDGSQSNDHTGQRARAALTAQLQDRGWDVAHVALCQQKIGSCAGDFFCWTRSPGICNINDDNRAIAAAIVNSDLTVYLTPITFGGYSSTLKGMVDHQIQNISPFFAMIQGETHHRKRYQQLPDLLAVGWLASPDGPSEAVFRHLVQRNALNMYAKHQVSGVVYATQSEQEMAAAAGQWLRELREGRSSQPAALPASTGSASASWTGSGDEKLETRRALLLVGSPKTRKSTSNSLGGYLFQQLAARTIETQTIYLHTVLRSPQKMQALLDAVDAADLVALAFPLYCDALPAPVTEALERIAHHRQERDHRQERGQPRRQRFTAIANCGFPEAHHCAAALAICERFAGQAGFAWAGGLALGAGEMVNGVSLVEAGGMTIRIRQSLDLAAAGLAQDGAVGRASQEMLAKPVIPNSLYRLSGWLRWIRLAKKQGALKLLMRRPYTAKAA